MWSRRDKVITFLVIGILALAFCIRAYPIVVNDGGTIRQKLHWMVYGYDRVWYQGRTYVGPSQPMTFAKLEKSYGQGQTFRPTGARVIGLPLYNTARSLAFQKQHHVVSTLLFLKKPNDTFIVYSLSGGP